MKPIPRFFLWIAGLSIASWFGVALIVDRQTGVEVLCGMFGPLAAVLGTLVAADSAYRRNPEALLPLLVRGLAVKMVFFAVYVTIMLRVLNLRFAPFTVSFTGYFIAEYLAAAIYLQRLLSGKVR